MCGRLLCRRLVKAYASSVSCLVNYAKGTSLCEPYVIIARQNNGSSNDRRLRTCVCQCPRKSSDTCTSIELCVIITHTHNTYRDSCIQCYGPNDRQYSYRHSSCTAVVHDRRIGLVCVSSVVT